MKRLFANFILIGLLAFYSLIQAKPELYFGALLGPGINYFTNNKSYVHVYNPAHASMGGTAIVGISVNRWLSPELSYSNLGYYENYGDGAGFCNIHGQCWATQGQPETFPAKLHVFNQITAQYVSLVNLFHFLQFAHFQLFAKLGVSYADVSLHSRVTVFPNIKDIGFEIHEEEADNNRQHFYPVMGIGYSYQANKHVSLRTEFNYYSSTVLKDVSTGETAGTLEPMSLFFGAIVRW